MAAEPIWKMSVSVLTASIWNWLIRRERPSESLPRVELVKKFYLLSERAAELGKLDPQSAHDYFIVCDKKEDELDRVQIKLVLNAISRLSRAIEPEYVSSIIRRKNKHYKWRLSAFTLIIFMGSASILYSVIYWDSYLASAKQVLGEVVSILDSGNMGAGKVPVDINLHLLDKIRMENAWSSIQEVYNETNHVEILDKLLMIPDVKPSIFEKNCEIYEKNTIDDEKFFRCFYHAKIDIEQVVTIVSTYLLPVLYGMLGAIVFILRKSLFSRFGIVNVFESCLDAPIRIGLGGLAGLAVGWFNPASEIGQLARTPFALAFVAGFSLDVLFSFLDRVILAFSGSPAVGQR